MSSSTKQAQAHSRDLKQRVLTCLHKLSDRDTQNAAASELESIAKTLTSENLPPFLSSISATDSSDKSPVRRHCVRLISVLSEHHHANLLSPHLSKLLTSLTRRLRDPDSSVRAACVAASFALTSNLASTPFSSISKPFIESLFTEQDANAQTGAALCLAAVIEGSENPDVAVLKRTLPRLEKLVKCEGFKAKAAMLALVASVVGVKGVLSGRSNVVRNLVLCLVELLGSEDWAVRKAAAEALVKIAVVERNALSEFKCSCLKTFESKKFDKVKAVRETMILMIDAWKEIPDQPDEVSAPPESQASCKDNASDGRYAPGSKTSIGSNVPQMKKRSSLDYPTSRTPLADGSPASTARKRSPLGSNENKRGTALFRKLDRKRPSESKAEFPADPSGTVTSKDVNLEGDGRVLKTGEVEQMHLAKPEIKRALFDENYESPELGVSKNGSRMAHRIEDSVVVSNDTRDMCRNQRDCEELSLIRKQLVQIESHQSNLLDLLQRFMGSSNNNMNSLETRVHGLELALDEISFDLAVSTGRASQYNGASCCKLPGSDFLSSKLWRKTEGRSSTSSVPASYGTTSMSAPRTFPTKSGGVEGFPLENRRYRFQGGRGLIQNPLADLPRGSRDV